MHTFSPKSDSERVVLTFDFSDQVGDDTIVSIDTIAVEILSGSDPYVAGMLPDAGAISGASIQVACIGGVNGNDYLVTCRIRTASETLELAGRLPVRKST